MKEELAKESIDLGLRLLKAFFNDAREHWNDWRMIFGELIRENSLLENEDEGKENSKYLSQDLPEKTDRLLLWLTKNMSYGVLKKISQSIGHEKLKQTFVDIAHSQKDQTSYELVDAAIRLDNYVDPRFNNIIELAKKLKDNQFSWEILRILVGNHMLFFPVTVSNLQRLCSTFDISYADEKNSFLVNEDKRKLLPEIHKRKKRRRRNKNKI